MQGDVDEMQGGGKDKLAKCRQISIVWMGLSLLREQGGFGRSREVSVRIAVGVQEQPQFGDAICFGVPDRGGIRLITGDRDVEGRDGGCPVAHLVDW
jgi:hypothetical protein